MLSSLAEVAPQNLAPHTSATTLVFNVIFVGTASIPYERTVKNESIAGYHEYNILKFKKGQKFNEKIISTIIN